MKLPVPAACQVPDIQVHKLGLQGHRVVQPLQKVEAELVAEAAAVGHVFIEIDDPLPVPGPGLLVEFNFEVLLLLLGRALAANADGAVGGRKAVAELPADWPLLVSDLKQAVHAVAAYPHALIVTVPEAAYFRPGVIGIV